MMCWQIVMSKFRIQISINFQLLFYVQNLPQSQYQN